MVPMGLAENDVSDFVEELMARHRQVEERLEHIDSLHRLATETLQEAQELAALHKSEGRKQSDEDAKAIIAEANERARVIIKTADKQAREIKQEAKSESERNAASTGRLAQSQDQPAPAPSPGQKTRHTFRWNAVPEATRYGLYLCQPPYGKEDFVYVREDLSETSLILPIDLEPSVIYKWTIRAGNAKGWGKPNPFKEYRT